VKNSVAASVLCAVVVFGLRAETDPGQPKNYECHRAARTIHIDGQLNESDWKGAPWSDFFVDIEGSAKPNPRYRTRMKMLWDDSNLYIGAELEESDIWATLTEHDAVIFHDNDFEVFLNPSGDGRNYFEFEINALNTSWDLFLPRPYHEGGKADNTWEISGLRSAIHIEGTLNDPYHKDRRWWVELALPWDAFWERSGFGRPRTGDNWRVNFSRVEWRTEVVDGKYRKLPGREDNWVWSPQGVINMHVPEHWGCVRFVSP
jgi:hypothetical protein